MQGMIRLKYAYPQEWLWGLEVPVAALDVPFFRRWSCCFICTLLQLPGIFASGGTKHSGREAAPPAFGT